MDENKIEEMRQVIQNASCKGIECEKCFLENSPTCVCVKALYNAGYRKEIDTAREIFEKIFEVLCCFTTQGKREEYNEGYIDCLEEVDKRLQNLAKEKYEVNNG